MSAKRFICIEDFVRFGLDIHVQCANGPCDHAGVVNAHDCWRWFKIHRWATSLDAAVTYRRFRCTKCGSVAGQLRPTQNPVTVLAFFPADDRGWKRAQQRLRG